MRVDSLGFMRYDFEDLVIGETYKYGKENYIILEIKEHSHKVKNYGKKKEELGTEYRMVTATFAFCRKTTDLDSGTIYIMAADKFEVKVTRNSTNQILYVSEEDMSEINDALENNNKDYTNSFVTEFKEDKLDFYCSVENGKVFYSLSDENGELISKKTATFDFNKKLILKHPTTKKSYSIYLLEKNI